MNNVHIFNSRGQYIGFISNNIFYSFRGEYMGWLENRFVWDKNGQFKGLVEDIGGHSYILRNSLQISPLPRMPKAYPPIAPPPPPQTYSVPPIQLPVGYEDAF